ncbi:hypothetical protein [Parasitella parasitica]|uniref:Rho-GAP domain-containing protein n=1 Tax=Parasitella parasitica TaxID=35722 RepID=A0A0B7N769_9FUNG|nr:hypothetical protein [Parasitella parasitica]
MAQYLLAQWDYTAEGDFELSFKEGFFPANRTKPCTEEHHVIDLVKRSTSALSSSAFIDNSAEHNNIALPPIVTGSGSNTSVPHSNPYFQTTSNKLGRERETVSAPAVPRVLNQDFLINTSTENEGLPLGWSLSRDEASAAFDYNETAGEAQWEGQPTKILISDDPQPSAVKRNEDSNINGMMYDIQRLNLEALHPNWVRIQNNIQIKVLSAGGETELPWKDYYGVLTNGFLLVYKEGLTSRIGRRPSSLKPVPAFFTIDLKSSEITPASKADTRKKHALIIQLAHHRVFVNVNSEALYAEWLDAMMRELISTKENTDQQDKALVQLLSSIPLNAKLELHNAESIDDSKSAKTLTRWFSRSNRNSIQKSQTFPLSSTTTSTATSGNEVFGGHLKLEEDGNIPHVVRLCIEQVDKRGLDVVGIYRLSGQTTSIQKYKAQFNSADPEQVDLEQEHDINVITGLLKLYFRELKNPLLTFEYYDRFIEAAKLQDYDERMFRLKSIIQVLPVVNYKVFQYLARHLERVKSNSRINKMESSNLALIFSIGLLRPRHDDLSASIMHNDLSSKVIETIITHVDWFFDTDTDDDSSSVTNNSSFAL